MFTRTESERLEIATLNVNSLTVRLPQLLDWLSANPVDAIVLQETKLTVKAPRFSYQSEVEVWVILLP